MSPEARIPEASGKVLRFRLPDAFATSRLRQIWAESRDSKKHSAGGAGIDRIGAYSFAQNLPHNLELIRSAIRTGNFHFSRLRAVPISKASGGVRIIAVPTVRDRLVQRAILSDLEGRARLKLGNQVSFGFQKGRSLTDAQLRAHELRSEAPFVFQADIIKFFDRIPRPLVKERVARVVRNPTILKLLSAAIDLELDYKDPYARHHIQQNGIRRGVGLRQGMPLSPFLSNLLLREFDESLERARFRAVRYADDLTIFGKSYEECEEALAFVRDQLRSLELEIPELAEGSKTKIASPIDDVEFLGIVLRKKADGYRILAPSRKIEEIEARLREVAAISFCVKNQKTLADTVRTMDAIILGYNKALAIAEDRKQFSERLHAHGKKCRAALMAELIGPEALASLSQPAMAILGVADFPSTRRRGAA